MMAILDIQLENAQAVAEEILSQGGKKSITVRMDITDIQEVKRAVWEAELSISVLMQVGQGSSVKRLMEPPRLGSSL